MKNLDPVAFTVELGKMYELSKKKGKVSVTMKRMNAKRLLHLKQVTKSLPKGGEQVINKESEEYPTLVRASYNDSRISTIVSPDEFNKFQNSYATVIRAYMDNLKKKERTKKAKNAKTQKSK